MTLDIIVSPDLAPVQHGFFSRRGGASSGVFAGLNCGPGSSDQREIVAINRARAAAALDLPAQALITLHQTHSTDVVTLDAVPEGPRIKADAMVTATPGLGLGVLTADCQPVLMADAQAGVIGAVHAGWKGALAGVLEATIEAMIALGAGRERIVAAIGPTISQRAYEVGPEFFEQFHDEDRENARFFANGEQDRYMFDLPGYGLHRLRDAGVTASWSRHCTYSEPERFYSYRRSQHDRQADYGRLISVIRL